MRLLAQAPGDALALEERALAIAAGAVRDLFTQQARRNAPVRPSTERFHRERCEATITYMSAHLQEPLQLGTLGRAVGVSPFHLCRVFRRLVGIPIHRYLTRLRLRAGLEAVEEGATDLAAVAAGLGFSSHSHFTSAFGREFGTTPSQLRGRWKELAAPASRRRLLRPAS
jgi:transcriptional regulator GlxA family with amidase domain